MTRLFVPVPTARLQWEGVDEYNGGMQRIGDFEVELKYVGPAFIQIAEEMLTPDEADALLAHLRSALHGQMRQGERPGHPFSVETTIVVHLDDNSPLPMDRVDELMGWLEYVLGYQTWDPNDTEWEY